VDVADSAWYVLGLPSLYWCYYCLFLQSSGYMLKAAFWPMVGWEKRENTEARLHDVIIPARSMLVKVWFIIKQ
jgi:hypothetical protein